MTTRRVGRGLLALVFVVCGFMRGAPALAANTATTTTTTTTAPTGPPVIELQLGSAPAIGPTGDCTGPIHQLASPGVFSVVRSGNLAPPVEVTLAYGGTLVNGVDYTAPTSVTVSGMHTFTDINVLSYKDGTVTATVVGGPRYVIGRTRSVTLTFQTIFPTPNCERETVRRTTTVGHTPADAGELFLPGSEGGQSSFTRGHLPPGLTIDFNGSFGGEATTTGTFTYSVFQCFEDICTHEVDVIVTVLPAGANVAPTTTTLLPSTLPPSSPGLPTAPPAQPISAPAEFTG